MPQLHSEVHPRQPSAQQVPVAFPTRLPAISCRNSYRVPSVYKHLSTESPLYTPNTPSPSGPTSPCHVLRNQCIAKHTGPAPQRHTTRESAIFLTIYIVSRVYRQCYSYCPWSGHLEVGIEELSRAFLSADCRKPLLLGETGHRSRPEGSSN